MYAGRSGYGSGLPYSLGERSNAPFNLGEVSQSGYGPYLGNFFDDLAKIAGKVGLVSNELSKVASGDATIATIPTGQASLTLPIPGSPISTSIPLWVIGAGAAGLLFVAFRRKRR
jgi:hypothetical protein